MDIEDLKVLPAVYTTQLDIWSLKDFMDVTHDKAQAIKAAHTIIQMQVNEFQLVCKPGETYNAVLVDDIEMPMPKSQLGLLTPTISVYCDASFAPLENALPSSGLERFPTTKQAFERE